MKKTIKAGFLFGILLLAAPGYAEIYKYIDETGQKRWTDDLSQVPKDQRPAKKRVTTENTEMAPGNAAGQPEQTNSPAPVPETETIVPDALEPGRTVGSNREDLIRDKADLDAQYQRLMEERLQLEKRMAEDLTTEARAELNKRVSTYNQNTETFDRRLNDFYMRVEQYNRRNSAEKAKAAQ